MEQNQRKNFFAKSREDFSTKPNEHNKESPRISLPEQVFKTKENITEFSGEDICIAKLKFTKFHKINHQPSQSLPIVTLISSKIRPLKARHTLSNRQEY